MSDLKGFFFICVFQVERCYYFLNAFVETAQKKEPVEGRLVQFLLSNPTNDGGQWDMLVNIIGERIGQEEPFLKLQPGLGDGEWSLRPGNWLRHMMPSTTVFFF